MQAVCEAELASLTRGLPHDEYLRACGRFQMIEALTTLIDTIDQQARVIDEHRRPPDPTDTDRSALTFYGSSFWDALTKRTRANGTAG